MLTRMTCGAKPALPLHARCASTVRPMAALPTCRPLAVRTAGPLRRREATRSRRGALQVVAFKADPIPWSEVKIVRAKHSVLKLHLTTSPRKCTQGVHAAALLPSSSLIAPLDMHREQVCPRRSLLANAASPSRPQA
eukprot:365898-Chlamydomonas_euryale.AAC.14